MGMSPVGKGSCSMRQTATAHAGRSPWQEQELEQRIRRRMEQLWPEVEPEWKAIEAVERIRFRKVLQAFRESGIGLDDLGGSTGYGYHDRGRKALEAIYARVFSGEAALVRPQVASGTHAISTCLFALLSPGDRLVCANGTPYDTLYRVMTSSHPGSLTSRGVQVDVVPLTPEGRVDEARLVAYLRAHPDVRMVFFQRSRGYAWRPALRMEELAHLVRQVREACRQAIIFVDNCYGEFVEEWEPLEVGADLIAGSLIKNPGGGLAPGGGYVVGETRWVQKVADGLIAPGLGLEIGPTYGLLRPVLQGLFVAPHTVAEALKGAVLAAHLLASLGIPVSPRPGEPRGDIVQAIQMPDQAGMEAFCWGIQEASPIDSYLRPVPGAMPGYDVPVIMAGGTFVQGSSIELSADGPLREPYRVYLQGGLSRAHVEEGLVRALVRLCQVGGLDAGSL